MKIVQWEPSCSTRAGGRTDMTKLIIVFRNFTNTPKNCKQIKAKTECCINECAKNSHQTSAYWNKTFHSYM
jgi:hypothetical protein